MIDVLKSAFMAPVEFGWRAPLAAAASSVFSALAPLFVVSSRILIDPVQQPPRQRSVATAQNRVAAIKHEPSREPRSAGSHWLQIAQGIESRLQSARQAVELQSAALVQVDAADFTLAKIIEDLSAVMPRAPELRARPSAAVLVARQALAA
jgi:hypothetical protein